MVTLDSRTIPFGLSVVIPTYNRRTALLRAVQSVQASAGAPVEIVVVDDGSTEDPADYLPATNRSGVRIRCYRFTANRGPQAARNLGIRRARYEFVAFLDSDDEFQPGKVTRVLEVLAAGCIDLLFHAVDGMERYNVLARRWWNARWRPPIHWLVAAYNPAVTPALVVRRRRRLGIPWMRHSEDWGFLMHYCDGDIRARYLDEPLCRVDRPQRSGGGLSAAAWQMRRGEFTARRVLLRQMSVSAAMRFAMGSFFGVLRIANDLVRGRYRPASPAT